MILMLAMLACCCRNCAAAFLCLYVLPQEGVSGMIHTPFFCGCGCFCFRGRCCWWCRTPCLFGWSDMQRLLAQTLPDSVPINLGMQFDQ